MYSRAIKPCPTQPLDINIRQHTRIDGTYMLVLLHSRANVFRSRCMFFIRQRVMCICHHDAAVLAKRLGSDSVRKQVLPNVGFVSKEHHLFFVRVYPECCSLISNMVLVIET